MPRAEVPPAVAPQDLARTAASLRSGELPLREYIIASLNRLDSFEPSIKALLPEPGRRERLLAEAAALEARFPQPEKRPPLYGVLLGVKDLFAADGFETRAGSRLPANLFAMAEGPVVKALKGAGALVLGKTVTTEFAYFSPGPTRNPWNTEHTPGGSSSGSAAAVAAGFCPLAIGTQTIGSISRPAAFCGVAGWKPSYGRTSSNGAVAFSPSLDHVGLFASTARSLALAAPLVTDAWNAEAYAAELTRFLPARPGSPKPVLAVPEGPYLDQAEQEARDVFFTFIESLRDAGFSVLSIPAFPDIQEINESHRRLAAAELERVHRDWFAAYRELYAPTTAEFIIKGAAVNDAQIGTDRSARLILRKQLDESLAISGADFWLSPAALGPAPQGIAATGSPIMNLPWTNAGVPTLALPSGCAKNGLPLAIQVAGRFGADEGLLAFGSLLEAFLARRV